jgi:hypothetical protein
MVTRISTFWTCQLEDVQDIMEDPIFKGNQNFSFKMDIDEAGKRLFSSEAKTGVAFQIGQLRDILQHTLYIYLCQGW